MAAPTPDEYQEMLRNAAKTVFSGQDGIFIFTHLMKFCGTFESNPGVDGVSIARHEGRRDVGLEISRLYDGR